MLVDNVSNLAVEPAPLGGNDGAAEDAGWIARATAVCEAGALGDFEQRVLHCDQRTPAGRLGIAINDLLDRADAFVRESAATLEQASQGNFFRRVLPNGMVGAYRRAAHLINTATDAMAAKSQALSEHEQRRLQLADQLQAQVGSIVATLAESATNLRTTAQQLAELAQATSTAAAQGLSAAGVAGEHVQHVAQVGQSLSDSEHQVESRVGTSRDVAHSAVDDAARTAELMEQLGAANQRIGDVVTLVANIARQTNLLSLNASIEAARAGDAGRGFAVVAHEVKKLADETAGATKQITKEVAAVQSASRDTALAIGAVEQKIQNMNALAGEIDVAVRDQILVTGDVQVRLRETEDCVRQAARSIEQTGQAAERTTSTAETLLQSADLLSRQTSELHTAVETFLRQVRGC